MKDADKKIEQTNSAFVAASAEFSKVKELLAAKRGAIQLSDLIENEGKKEVQRIIREDIREVERQIKETQAEIDKAKAEMRRYEDAARKKATTKRFRELMGEYLEELEVHNLEATRLFVHTKVSETGSDLPRALLAYYYSILHLIRGNESGTFCPVVIDSPNQQDQDLPNLRKMLTFIHDRRPKDMQLVLGLVDDCGVSFDGDIIELTQKHALLNKDEYDQVAEEVRQLQNAARDDETPKPGALF